MNEKPIIIPAPRSFTPGEAAFAWLSILCGYIFCRAFPVCLFPMGGFLLIVLLFSSSTFVFIKMGRRPSPLSLAVGISGLVVALALPLSSGDTIHSLAMLYAVCAWLCFVYGVWGNSLEKGFTNLIAIDFFKALIMPFCSFTALFSALFYGRAKLCGRFLLHLLIGILIAFVPTCFVISNLSYDSGFNALLGDIFSFENSDLLSHLAAVIFGIPVGMYFFGALVSSRESRMESSITAPGCRAASARLRIAPAATAVAACLPILFLYVVFFISQWDYYVSAFGAQLPQGFDHAHYARSGFFQLCSVAVINLLLLSSLSLFMKRNNAGKNLLYKLLALVFCLFTLVLIATAMAKLVLYIDFYGLTPKRVYAAWFMCVLALIFILVAVKQFVSRISTVAWAMAIFVVMFAALGLSNPGTIIARYNVDRYEAGTLESVDIEAMEELGIAAVPELVRLKTMLEEQGETKSVLYMNCINTLRYLKDIHLGSEGGIFRMNLPWIMARKALGDVYLPSV